MIARKPPAVATPWGASDSEEIVAPGIKFYGTPSHGGFHLDAARMAVVRHKFPGLKTFAGGPWFEEDCDWCFVALAFPEFFKPEEQTQAENTLRHGHPDHYERFFNRTLKPGESYKRDSQTFDAAHANDLVGVSATSGTSWEPVPAGMVKVTATIGGKRDFSQAREFLVTSEEYQARDHHGFIVDPTRHQELSKAVTP